MPTPSTIMATACVLLFLLLSATAAKPPHIMFFVVDDLGWNDVGFQRGAVPDHNQTNAVYSPHLDELAAAGANVHRPHSAKPKRKHSAKPRRRKPLT